MGGCSLIVGGELDDKATRSDGGGTGLDAGLDARPAGSDDDAGVTDAGDAASVGCPPGEQDNDDDGTCQPTCESASLTCSTHERCDDADGTARCVCASGYQDNDKNGTCTPDCTDAVCDEHLHCEDESGAAECVCDEGYVGKDCDACDKGFQDNDSDGSCLVDCGHSDLDCGSHGACDDAGGEARCACDFTYAGATCGGCEVGYKLNSSGICKWNGIVKNPGFDDESAWATHGSAAIDGGGFAKFPHDATCAGGSVRQTVTVPPLANSDVLVLHYDVRLGSGFDTGPRPYVSLGTQPYESDTTNLTNWTANSVCLGANAYGRDLEIVLRSARIEGNMTCIAYEDADFDNVRIVPATPDECPTPGSGVLNGDFTTDSDWASTSVSGSAMIAAGDLTLSGIGATTVSAEGSAAVPIIADGEGLGVEVTWTGDATDDLTISLDGYPIGVASGGGDNVVRLCVPGWASGGTMPIGLSARDRASNGVTAIVSNVQLVDDDRCIGGGAIQGDFEPLTGAPTLLSPWTFQMASNMQATTPVGAITDATGPTKALDLQVTYKCTHVFAYQYVQVPQSSGANGPAVQFDYTLAIEPATFDPRFAVCLGSVGSNECVTQTPSASFAASTFCLSPARSGQVMQLTFYLEGGGGACANTYAPAYQARVDNVVVTTQAGCPAE